MSAQHTKGPWSVFKDIGTPAGTLKVAQEHWLSDPFSAPLVAAVYGKEGEQKANANLIAAAPELLRVADMLADVGDTKLGNLLYTEQLVNLVRDLRMEARAAVAKAKGEAP